jgi:hypothetical protein
MAMSRSGTAADPVENWVIVFADGKVVDNSPAKRSIEERNRALNECAELCLRSNDAKKCAREYVARLIEDGWNKDDAREVLTIVLGIIANNAPSAFVQVQANNAAP